jgi:hypothetical protein
MLPLLYVSTNMSKSEASYTTYESASLLDEKNQNLSYSQKVILAWHQKLNHIGFGHVKWLASKGYIGNKTRLAFSKLEQFELPKCATCQFGKQERKSTPERQSKKAQVADILAEGTITLSGSTTYKPAGILRQGAEKPGSRVAMDQYVHTTPGRGPSIKGITPSSMKYVGGTLFVDCHTGYIKCVHQTSLNALETLMAKQIYERGAAQHGVQVTGYHTDNGVFTSRSFIDEIQQSKQRITFTGVNAHHQNIAERAIKTTHYLARCMMLHSAIHWPEAYDPSLWPFAVSYACHIMNSLPRQDTNASPEELWTGVKVDHESVLDALLPWGCPSYVLDSTLASGGKIPKFQPRSRRAQFLGFSEYHSQKSVCLVRNLTTMRVSPQYHVVYDAMFSTTLATEEHPPTNWVDLVMHSRHKCALEFDMDESDDADPGNKPPAFQLHNEWLTDEERRARREEEEKRRVQAEAYSDKAPMHTAPTEESSKVKISVSEEARASPTEDPTSVAVPHAPQAAPSPLRRSKRDRLAPSRLTYEDKGSQAEKVLGGYLSLLSPSDSPNWYDAAYISATMCYDAVNNTVEDYLPGYEYNPWSLIAKKKHDPDLPRYEEAMCGPYKDKFVTGMEHEVSQLNKMDTWIEVDEASLPPGTHVVKTTWSFKIARLPDGTIKKFRSRFCVRGDTQKDVGEVFAPVVQWSTIKMCLSMANQLDLHSRAIDISNAFCTAPLDPSESKDIYVEMPRGSDSKGKPFKKQGKVLKLKKSLYGMAASPRYFANYLKKVLTDPKGMNFQQATFDQCLFIKDDIVIVTYVDDLLFFAKSNELIDAEIKSFKKTFAITEDAKDQTVFSYLGIQIKRGVNSEGNRTTTLLQPGLINKLMEEVKDKHGVPYSKARLASKEYTPMGDPLGAAKDDMPFTEREFGFAYNSALGMLHYAVHTRPDILYAVNCCSRFAHAPKRIHGEAIRRIVRYLRHTQGNGLTYTATSEVIEFDCYVDCDFQSLFGYEDSDDPNSARSRTGYVFTLGGNPVHTASKLHTSIALSSTESEYVGISTALREFIPMRTTAGMICKAFKVETGQFNQMKSTIWEDNNGALKNAQAKRITPRTRHINCIYHWFWTFITGDEDHSKGIVLKKIDTKLQLADICTKPQDRHTFETIRKLLMGW